MDPQFRRKIRELELLGISGLCLFLLLLGGCSRAEPVQVNTALAGREKDWSFVGRSTWTEKEGVIYSPLYSNPMFDRGTRVPRSYADYAVYVDHPEFHSSWEYAYPSRQFFSDLDASITFEPRFTSGQGCGLALRAQDSLRLYTVEVRDMGRKGHDWRVALLLHDGSGYRTELAVGYAPHSVVPEDCLHGRIKDSAMWEKCSPAAATLHVKAEGPKIGAYIDGKEVFTAEDSTYLSGASGIFSGIVAANTIRDYKLAGVPAEGTVSEWRQVDRSKLVSYPFASGAAGRYTGQPYQSRAGTGELILSFAEGKARPVGHFGPEGPVGVAFTVSKDEGKTWSPPTKVAYQKEGHTIDGRIYVHQDGRWFLIGSERKDVPGEEARASSKIVQLESVDGGETWSQPREILFGGKPAFAYGWRSFNWPYAIIRLRDGTLIGTGYRVEVAPGAKTVDNATRRDQSFVIRSTDDGRTWSAPIFIDTTEFDTNECMVGEPQPGQLISFSRTLRARNMWISTSEDGGLHWSALRQSSVSGECPVMLTHSSGALVLATRGSGVTISFDGGRTWTKPRMLTVDGMMTMAELTDGRVLIAGHMGWANPTYITADTFRVTPEGPVADRKR